MKNVEKIPFEKSNFLDQEDDILRENGFVSIDEIDERDLDLIENPDERKRLEEEINNYKASKKL